MTFHIEIEYSTDFYDCETCGADSASAYTITYNGKVYGEPARAHCYSGYNNTLCDVASELFRDIDILSIEDDLPYDFDLNALKFTLTTLGYSVSYTENLADEDCYVSYKDY